MVAWFLLMILFIASALGARVASTRLWASEAVSMPEPPPSLLTMLLAAADAVELPLMPVLATAVLVEPVPPDVLAGGVEVLEEVEVTDVTIRLGIRFERLKL